jgi:C1A family cysteine protease
MKLLAAFLVIATVSAFDMTADEDWPKFQEFMTTYSRRYATASETRGRFSIFKDNLVLIAQRNAAGGKDKHGINKFTDIHPEEFKAQYLGLRPADLSETEVKSFNETELADAGKKTINWVERGATTPVKNQGQCGSCWAFSTTEQIESDTFLATGVLNVLAPQQIVSCDTVDLGCNGGNPINAYSYVSNAGGVEFSKDYPYTSGTTQANGVCSFNAKDIAKNTAPTGYTLISSKPTQEKNMLTQIEKSPMSVCVDATLWQTYQSGIITVASQCGTSIDHAVQAVGYNAEENYWIVRNSWAADWGENGYVYVEAGHNVCGISHEATITAQPSN